LTDAARPKALVTGASSGIGRAFAERLAFEGYDLVLVARRADRLRELGNRLTEGGAGVEVLPADLADPVVLRIVEARAGGGDLALLVNNAEFGGYMPFGGPDSDTTERLIGVHVTATTRLTRAVLPAMIRRKKGAVINVASLLVFSESLSAERLPYRATHGGCKAYIVAFSQLLCRELAGTGVEVQVCCPGVVETDFHKVVGIDLSVRPLRPMLPHEVVTASLASLRRGERICIPALEDADLLERYDVQRQRPLVAGNPGPLAEGYEGDASSD
jgi:uncharacterized protein